MIKRLLVAILGLAVVFGGIFGWKLLAARKAAAQAAAPRPPVTVASAEVRKETWQPSLRAVGSLVAVQGVQVTNELAGQVLEIHFVSGQQVAKGDLLMQLDDSVDKADLEGLIAQQHLAEAQFQRTTELFKEETLAQADFDQAKANLENARAQVASKQAVIRKKRIVAPFDGWLGIREIDLGQYLAPGSSIVPLQALDPIYVDYSLPEQDHARLSEGQAVTLRVQAYPERSFEGHVSALDPGIDPGTRAVHLRATLKNPDRLLRPGMFAEVQTLLPEHKDVLTVPRTAVTYNPYGDAVFVIVETQGELTVQSRQIETGEVRNGRVEVVKGLQEGERLVSAGQVKLRNGQRVRIDNSVKLDEEIAGR